MPRQTSKMECFRLKAVNYFRKVPILDVWKGSEYVCVYGLTSESDIWFRNKQNQVKAT